jgi:peptidoglycan/xylan/chitin deacetylase (PgdA/CDA1 family)
MQLFGPKKGTRVPILMYHSISHNLFGKSHPYYQINTQPAIFSEQMRNLRNAGYRTVGLSEAWAALNAGEDVSKSVVLAFGEGYRDFYTDALEVLVQCGFTATLFLVTSRIRRTSLCIEGADYLTWDEVKQCQKMGMQFGSRTVTHPDLRSMNLDQIEYELGHSKEVIEQQLGIAVESFSYPFACPEEDKHFIRFLEDVLENIGFEYGVSSILGRAHCNSRKFFLPQLPVNSWDDGALLHAKLNGGYDWLHWPQLLKRSLWHNATLMQPNQRTRTSKPVL